MMMMMMIWGSWMERDTRDMGKKRDEEKTEGEKVLRETRPGTVSSRWAGAK